MNRIACISLLCCALPCAGALADEIVFKKEHGGGRVKCEIYREDDDYIYYIDVRKNEDCGCAREIVAEVVREPGELVNVEEFFLKKAGQARDERTREKAQAIAEELRRQREAAGGGRTEAAPADGTWSGRADGYDGPVEVSVTVKAGKITEVKVVKQAESAPRTALREVPRRIVAKQSVEVDAVTGATVSSKAVMDAAAAALKAARAAQKAPAPEPPASEPKPQPRQPPEPAPVPDPVEPAEPAEPAEPEAPPPPPPAPEEAPAEPAPEGGEENP